MSKSFDLIADFREDSGKGSSRRLRRQGKLPAIIYGGGKPPRSLSFDSQSMLHNMEQESFFSSVLTVKVGDKEQPAILKDVQMHPAKRQILHLDLQRIVADEKIRMDVPIHCPNEDIAPGVKLKGGTVARLLSEAEVSCLPKDLPEYLELDIAEMDLDEILHLSDIPLPAGVELTELTGGNDLPVITIHIIKAAAEPEDEEVGEEPVEGEVPPTAEGEEGES
jgi:large subunit ribosomal protein L25